MSQRAPGVNFGAREFKELHGHMPRGKALWVFYFADDPQEPWIPMQKKNRMIKLTYLDAKALAIAEARKRRVSSVRVDPQPL